MTAGLKTVIYPVTDLARAKPIYTALLGVEPFVDEPYYVGYQVGDQQLGLDPHGHRDGVTGYWEVEDINAALDTLVSAGAEVVQPVKDVGGGKQTAIVKDADGNITGISQS
jgi:predicted enzyme related to lactoylglutathione lyase